MSDRDTKHITHFRSRAVRENKFVPTSISKHGSNKVHLDKVVPKSLPRAGTMYEEFTGNPYSDKTWSDRYAYVGNTKPLTKDRPVTAPPASAQKRRMYYQTYDTFTSA